MPIQQYFMRQLGSKPRLRWHVLILSVPHTIFHIKTVKLDAEYANIQHAACQSRLSSHIQVCYLRHVDICHSWPITGWAMFICITLTTTILQNKLLLKLTDKDSGNINQIHGNQQGKAGKQQNMHHDEPNTAIYAFVSDMEQIYKGRICIRPSL